MRLVQSVVLCIYRQKGLICHAQTSFHRTLSALQLGPVLSSRGNSPTDLNARAGHSNAPLLRELVGQAKPHSQLKLVNSIALVASSRWDTCQKLEVSTPRTWIHRWSCW